MNGHDFYDPDADFTTEEITRCNELAMRVIFDGWKICKKCGGFGDELTAACRRSYLAVFLPQLFPAEIAQLPVCLRWVKTKEEQIKRWLEGGWEMPEDEPWAACPTCGSSVGCVQEEGQDPYYFCHSRFCVWGDFYNP